MPTAYQTTTHASTSGLKGFFTPLPALGVRSVWILVYGRCPLFVAGKGLPLRRQAAADCRLYRDDEAVSLLSSEAIGWAVHPSSAPV